MPILRCREPGTEPASTSWEQSRMLDVEEDADLRVNAYFDEHPEHVLGSYAVSTGQYGAPALRVVAHVDARVDEDLTRALADITSRARRDGQVMTAGGELAATRVAAAPALGLWDGHLTAHPDRVSGCVRGTCRKRILQSKEVKNGAISTVYVAERENNKYGPLPAQRHD